MGALVDQLAGFRASSSVLEGDGQERPPTAEEFARPIAAPGQDALIPYGVEYHAGWEPLADGMARHARQQVRALARHMPVALRSLPIARIVMDEELDPGVVAEVGYLRHVTMGQVGVSVRQLVLHSRSFLENVIAPPGARLAGFADELRVYRSTILYTSWERSTVQPDLIEVLRRVGQVWVPCAWNREVFVAAGLDREHVHVVPCPYDPWSHKATQIAAPRGSEHVPGGKRFYAIGKWEPRKNYHALLGAFLQEFTPKEKASLFIKTSEWGGWKGYPRYDESLPFWLQDPVVRENGWTPENVERRVRIATKKLPEDKLVGIHRDNNIYVTCSHGEAWDLPAFDAACAGNRLVYTGLGGAEDYAGAEDVRIVPKPAGLAPVHESYGWERDACWADIPTEQLRRALRDASPPAKRLHPASFHARFGAERVGQMMKEHIEALLGHEIPGGYG